MSVVEKCVYIFCIAFSALVDRTGSSYQSYGFSRNPISLRSQSSYNPSRRFVEILREKLDPEEELGLDLSPEEMIKFKIWPQGTVPYYIDVESFRDKVLRDRIREFLGMVNSVTGLNFMEYNVAPSEDERWVLFINRRSQLDCADHTTLNFTNTGPQRVILGYDCMSEQGELGEAVLSIAGVPPQHNAPNRNDYIDVFEQNIMPDKKYLFKILKDDEWLFHDIPYDFDSVGHYHFHKYSVNGQATINAKKSLDRKLIGAKNGFLSRSDIKKIKMLYSIIRKKSPTKMPECYKLFRPGAKFHQLKPDSLNRKKPNETLSRPSKNSSEDVEKKANVDGKSDKEAAVDGSEADITDEERHKEAMKARIIKSEKTPQIKSRIRLSGIKEKLMLMSDYATGNERGY